MKNKSHKIKKGGVRPGSGRKKMEGMVKILASLREDDINWIDSQEGSRQDHLRAAVTEYRSRMSNNASTTPPSYS
jgi:hypothetical protein